MGANSIYSLFVEEFLQANNTPLVSPIFIFKERSDKMFIHNQTVFALYSVRIRNR
jgi:hypothetical protein